MDDLSRYAVQAALEDVFQGCRVSGTTAALGGSQIVEVHFHEYEIRVILDTKSPKAYYRFLQLIPPREGQKPIRRPIIELETTDPEELQQAIDDSKAQLLGLVFAITKALRQPQTNRTTSIEDLFRPGGG